MTTPDSGISEEMNNPDGARLEEERERAEQWLRSGEPLLAYNTVKEALDSWPDDLRLRQLEGLALARSGAVERANRSLAALRDEGHVDGETLGLLGRTHKDLALAMVDEQERNRHQEAAFSIYEAAYLGACERGNVGEAYYTGINAATLALLKGDHERAREIAGHVVQLCLGEVEDIDKADYWMLATLGEAAVIHGDFDDAGEYYRRAAAVAGGRYADLSSTRRQARLLLDHLGEDGAWLEESLAIPPVLVFTGHMIDRADRARPRFPAEAEEQVRQLIRDRIETINPIAAYGSAACGADILCLEAVLERGGELHIVLPFPPQEFREVSVDLMPGSGWGDRFDRVMEAATSVLVASDHYATGSSATFDYANLILTGMGVLRSRVLQTGVVGLAVWDGAAGDGAGGTAGMVDRWHELGLSFEHVDLGGFSDLQGLPQAPAQAAWQGLPEGFSHEIKAMLFADAVGYSKMSEDQIPVFIQHFLGAVADLNRRTEFPPIHMEVAGDGLYFVFEHTAAAGRYGIELSDLVRDTDWRQLGLPATLDMRVGLHGGPVYTCIDPITGGRMFTGPHTSRTARIEPITPPGQVYASSAFAAVAAASGVSDLSFDYIGRTNLAKKYGSLALYHVQRPVV